MRTKKREGGQIVKRKIRHFGHAPALFVPSTPLFSLCPHSVVPSSSESVRKKHISEEFYRLEEDREGTNLSGCGLKECQL